MTSPLKILTATARGVLALVVAALLWELVALCVGPAMLIPDLLTVIRTMVRAYSLAVFWENVATSLRRLAAGYAAAAVIGIPIGLALGRVKALRLVLGALVSGLASSPLVVLAPLTTLWLGVGDGSVVLLAFMSAAFPLMSRIMAGRAHAEPQKADAMPQAQAREQRSDVLHRIVAGLRVALIPAVGAVVVAEMVGSVSGLGLLLMNSAGAYDVAAIVAVVLVIALPSIVAVDVLRSIEAHLAHESA
jgi:ABC-type nitrate/sulfonate/bicarbonate transport system permease component